MTRKAIEIILLIVNVLIWSFAGFKMAIAFSQTVTQLDDDNYYVQYLDGTNETMSLRSIAANVNGCQAELDKYGNVLSIINGDQNGLVDQTAFDSAVQSVQSSQQSKGAASPSQLGP